jgi:hypothetical protein
LSRLEFTESGSVRKFIGKPGRFDLDEFVKRRIHHTKHSCKKVAFLIFYEFIN